MPTRVPAPGMSSLTCTRPPAATRPPDPRSGHPNTNRCTPRFCSPFGIASSLAPLPLVAQALPDRRYCAPQLTAFSKPFTPSVCFTLSPTQLTLRDALLQLPLARLGPDTRPACTPDPPPSGAAPSGHVPDPLAGQPHLPDSPRASQPPPRRGLALAARICLRVRPALFPLARRLASASHPRMVLGMTPARCGQSHP